MSVQRADVATAPGLRSAWRTLRTAPDRIMVPTLVLSTAGIAVHVMAQYLIGITIAGSHDCARNYLGTVLAASCGPTDQRAQLALVVGMIALLAVGHLVVAGLYRACLGTVDSSPLQGPFASWVTWSVVVTSVAMGVLLTINTIFLLLPALVLGFLSRYVLLFVVDQRLSPVAALVASTRFVTSNFGSELGFVLRAFGLLLLGFLALGIGLYVAVPVVVLAQTQRYRARSAR